MAEFLTFFCIFKNSKFNYFDFLKQLLSEKEEQAFTVKGTDDAFEKFIVGSNYDSKGNYKQFAASELKKVNLRLLIEPINTYDIPGFYLSRTAQAIGIMDEVGTDNLYLQYDIYHAQRMEGELANTIEKYLPRIAHIQLADNPGRNEPGTGEINYRYLLAFLDRIGYKGWVGCEYKPLKNTAAGLS